MTTDGNRTLTVQPNGTKVYTPFPDYEETVPASGGATKRVTFSLAGQLIAVRVITDTTNNYYYAYADHLGNISAWTNASGALVSGSLARYELAQLGQRPVLASTNTEAVAAGEPVVRRGADTRRVVASTDAPGASAGPRRAPRSRVLGASVQVRGGLLTPPRDRA